MNLKVYSKDALMVLVGDQQKELALLRDRLAEVEGRAERAEAGARSAWQFARTIDAARMQRMALTGRLRRVLSRQQS